jgi:hypothetical protein
MNSWPGKVLQINYVDPDESDLNDAFNDAVKKATDVDKTLARIFLRDLVLLTANRHGNQMD